MSKEIVFIMAIVTMGVIIIALVYALRRAHTRITRMEYRSDAYNDYILNIFLTNKLDDERKAKISRSKDHGGDS